MKTVAVFFGGRSNEREISVITGMYCVNLLRASEALAYRVLPVYLPPEGGFLLGENLRGVEDFQSLPSLKEAILVRGGIAPLKKPKKRIPIDCALNCCHGGDGEGGVLSALLKWNAIPSASPGMEASAVFLDKSLSKIALGGLGIPTAPSFCVREEKFPAGDWKAKAEKLGYPLIAKPCRLGSSVGVRVAREEEELGLALKEGFRLDGKVLVEKYLAGKRDLNLAAYRSGDRLVLSPVEEVFSEGDILSFGEKYEGRGKRPSKIPAELPQEIVSRMEEMLVCVYEQFGIRGVVRADFLLCGETLYFNELNTVPGTLAAYLFGGSLTDARKLLVALVEEGSHAEKEREIFESGILSSAVFGAKSPKTAPNGII